jgi:hypothetical protein
MEKCGDRKEDEWQFRTAIGSSRAEERGRMDEWRIPGGTGRMMLLLEKQRNRKPRHDLSLITPQI